MVKVMQMGGWKDLKTMKKYLRMAGIEIHGATDTLDFGTGDEIDGDEMGAISLNLGWCSEL
jgi:hypothetical protein